MAHSTGQSLGKLYCCPELKSPSSMPSSAASTSSTSTQPNWFDELMTLPAVPSHPILIKENDSSSMMTASSPKLVTPQEQQRAEQGLLKSHKHSDEIDADVLRLQNELLVESLKKLRLPSMDKSDQQELTHQLNTVEGTERFLKALQQYFDSPKFLDSLQASQSMTSTGMAVVSARDRPDEVGVIDIENVDWWTVIPNDPENGAAASSATASSFSNSDSFDDKVTEETSSQLSDSWVIVDESEVIASIAETVATVFKKTPEAQKLDDRQLQSMLSKTFSELREKTLTGRLWQYGAMAYSAYNWAKYGYTMYHDPRARWALRVLLAVMRYTCFSVPIPPGMLGGM